ncbi:unnamed protein product [Ilex paraguariensis]|uniref:Protein CHUP1, chloroplastic n=1 Tax=Ilex paraguariensis TaxID=185542 RepID=A0ABC8TCY4_9AQUA
MMMKDKRDIRPVLLKFGVALALSLGGILYSILRTKRIKPSQSPPSPPSSDCGNQINSGGERAVLKNDSHTFQTSPKSSGTPSNSSETHEASCLPKVIFDNSFTGLSPSGRSHDDKDELLLPEFNELLKEFDLAATKAGISPRKDVETPTPNAGTPRGYTCDEREDHEQEIKNLTNMVKILKERERNLEIQLLEYYGLKEQETAVMELQNRLKINNMEAKLFSLKIESLQADNRRLEVQVADYAKVVAELEAVKAKIKILKKKLRSEAEQNKEQILTLQQRVMKLQDQENNAVAGDPAVSLKLQRLKDLEEEAEELRKSNYSLRLQNSDLAQRLENVQILATSVLEDEGTEALKEETRCLRQRHEDLTKEIERLQVDRCSDVEELVYLRWINACLRYELRNYQPDQGKTIARDLSKTLSPKSEEKAKQLILEYANKEGQGENGINIVDFDYDRWSSSQASYLTDSGELDDSSIDNSSANKTNTSSKTKVFSKLMRLLKGKEGHHHSRGSSLETTACVEDTVGLYYSGSPGRNSGASTGIDAGTDGGHNRLRTSSRGSSRSSMDLQRAMIVKVADSNDLEGVLQRNSDAGSSFVYRRIDSIAENISDSPQKNHLHDQEQENAEKSELLKYAEVLKGSRGKKSFHRRSVSFSSF